MLDLFDLLLVRLQAGQDTMQVTVTMAEGATPTRQSSFLMAGEDGLLAGSVGGGALENRALQTARTLLRQKHGGRQKYRLVDGSGSAAQVELLYTYWNVCLAAVGLCNVICTEGRAHRTMHLAMPLDGTLPLGLADTACFDLTIDSKPRALVFGAGDVAAELVPLLAHLGWRCTVADPRAELANCEKFPDADEILCRDTALAAEETRIGPMDYICIMTPDHESDLAVLQRVLRTKARYIGVLGSATKKARNEKALLEQGFLQEELDRVATPIGLYIYSRTPAEVAVSIAAQMIREKNRGEDEAAPTDESGAETVTEQNESAPAGAEKENED